jgi:hypothetical protein
MSTQRYAVVLRPRASFAAWAQSPRASHDRVARHSPNPRQGRLGYRRRAAIQFDWIGGVPADEIERRYKPTPFQGAVGYGDITQAEGARFHLRSGHQNAPHSSATISIGQISN